MDGTRHPLPLTTVYHQLQPINHSPYTLLQALFGHEYPVELLDEEKILPVGKEINAAGLCILKNGFLEIKSCKDLPYFLSEMSKEQMVLDLAFETRILFWSGLILGTVSIGLLRFAFVRNWSRFKDWRQRRRNQEESVAATVEDAADDPTVEEDDELGNAPDGQLCDMSDEEEEICVRSMRTPSLLSALCVVRRARGESQMPGLPSVGSEFDADL